ncbi:MAG TPA: PHP-associated domain-containing protein [Terriglobales bacterium]|nr:PHP-associated domain-containing protein [Terriglobales bacterium]
MPLLKIDLHVHTVGSPDAHTIREDLPAIIRKRGLDGVAVTEHDNFDPPNLPDALILPGVEVSTREGHVVALGVRESILADLSADETIQRIHDQGGVAIVAHPYDPVSVCVKIARLHVRPDAVETMNADALSFFFCNWLARRDAIRHKLPQVGCSDSHIPETIGDAYTVIDSASTNLEDILDAIRAGRIRPEGHATSIRSKLKKLSYKFK